MFMAFGTTQDTKMVPMNESKTVCKLSTKSADAKRSECDKSRVLRTELSGS